MSDADPRPPAYPVGPPVAPVALPAISGGTDPSTGQHLAPMNPPSARRRWSAEVFAREILAGSTVGQAAQACGLAAAGNAPRAAVLGASALRHPRVREVFSKWHGFVEAGWLAGAKWYMDVARGAVETSDENRIQVISNLGRVLGLFTQKVEVSSKQVVEIRNFLTSRPVSAVSSAPIEVLEAELSARRAAALTQSPPVEALPAEGGSSEA